MKKLLSVLKTYIIDYPLITFLMKISLGKPFLLSIESPSKKIAIMEELSPDGVIHYTNFSDKSALIELLTSRSSEAVFIDVTGFDSNRSIQKADCVDLFKSVAAYSAIGNDPVFCMPIMICSGKVPENLRESVTLIPFKGDEKGNPFYIADITEISSVKETASHYIDEEIHMGLVAAASLYAKKYYPKSRDQNLFIHEITETITMLESFTDASQIPEMVAECFLSFLSKHENRKGYELPNLDDEALRHMEDMFFYRGELFYISTELFSKICSDISNIFKKAEIFEALEEAGYLITEKGKTTCRMTFRKPNGATSEMRMLKFNAANFERHNLNLIETVSIRRK